MNSSKANESLKSIDTSLNNMEPDIEQMRQTLNSLENILDGDHTDDLNSIRLNTNSTQSNVYAVNTTLATTNSTLATIDTSLNNIENDIIDIGITMSSLFNKNIINAKLTDGSNDYLDRIDYTSSPIIFYWENTLSKPVYITEYYFRYKQTSEPSSSEQYHSSAWTTKIGQLNSAGTDFDGSYLTYEDNAEYPQVYQSPKATWSTDVIWKWDYYFSNKPIKINAGERFGHYIAGNISSGQGYDSNPIGIIEGYYYNS